MRASFPLRFSLFGLATTKHASRGKDLRLERLEERTVLSASTGVDTGHDAVFDSHLFQLERITYLPEQTHLFDLEAGFVGAPTAGDPLDVAFDFLEDNAEQFGITAADVAISVVTNQYVSDHTGVTHIYLAQTHNGLRVANTSININVGADGRVINAAGNYVPGLTDNFADVGSSFQLTASEALTRVAKQLDVTAEIAPVLVSPATGTAGSTVLSEADLSLDDIAMQRYYVPTADGGVAPSWSMVLRTPDGQHWFNLGVDATTGDINSASDWVDYATYKVYAIPLEAPHDDPVDNIADRSLVVDPLSIEASPFGWHDINGVPGPDTTDTRGNNVFAQEDADADNEFGFRPNGGINRNFDFAIDFSQDPSLYVAASVTNLFYWNNVTHDVLYQYGFDEASGNFQLNNYGRGGIDGDFVVADAQDGSGFNNANFATPPDGENPRMQQFLFLNFFGPTLDSDLDNGIIVHEYGHGVSNRLTGGAANADALRSLQSGGMGEGWSDWLALMLTQKPTDTALTQRTLGTYAEGQTLDGPGIRRLPYTFEITEDTHSYAVYNVSNQVHDAGEIWASALWDLNWLLIDKYGYDPNLVAGYNGEGSAGNQLAMQLVLDGMKLQPANPSFLDARDAILLADEALTGGENALEIWTAFARRGMGASAFDGGSADAILVTEAFDIPVLGLTVIETDPFQESILDTRPTDFTLHFSTPFVPGSVDAADLTINGRPADGFTLVDADTIIFHYNTSPVTAEGPQIMEIAAGTLTEAGDGDPGFAWQGVFYYDLLPMAVVSTTPGEGVAFRQAPTTIELTFNEPIDVDNVDGMGLTLNVGTVRGVTVIDENTIAFGIGGIPTDSDLVVQYTLAAGAVLDAHGTPGPEYIGTFLIDDINLLRFDSPNVPFPIVDFNTTVSGLTVERSIDILDLDVAIDIAHTFDGELSVTLFAPNGTPIWLFGFVGGGGDNFTGTILDDDANRPIEDGTPPFTGRFQPFEELAPLIGTDVSGTWRLEVTDFAAVDEGALNSWALLVRVENAITTPGDTNGDGVVDIEDLNNVRNQFGATGAGVLGDTLPFDDVVDINDLNAVRNNFGMTGAPPLVAPPAPTAPADTAPDSLGLVLDRLNRRRNETTGRVVPPALVLNAGSTEATLNVNQADSLAQATVRRPAARLASSTGLSRRVVAHAAGSPRTLDADVWDVALESLVTPEVKIRRR